MFELCPTCKGKPNSCQNGNSCENCNGRGWIIKDEYNLYSSYQPIFDFGKNELVINPLL